MGTPVSQEEFTRLLSGFERSAFRLETQDSYALDYEREFFERFLAGDEPSPHDYPWYRSWLEQIARLTAEGQHISRVRILADPPTSYQRSEMWGDRWHAEAGEQIRYIPRSRAAQLGLPLDHDWWLLDNRRLIEMRFTPDGEVASRILHADPHAVAPYLAWRDLAVHNATPAGETTAA